MNSSPSISSALLSISRSFFHYNMIRSNYKKLLYSYYDDQYESITLKFSESDIAKKQTRISNSYGIYAFDDMFKGIHQGILARLQQKKSLLPHQIEELRLHPMLFYSSPIYNKELYPPSSIAFRNSNYMDNCIFVYVLFNELFDFIPLSDLVYLSTRIPPLEKEWLRHTINKSSPSQSNRTKLIYKLLLY